MKLLNPWRLVAAILCAAALLAPGVDARTRKGDKLLKDGQKAEATQDFDSALTYYEQALDEDPREPAYLLPAQRAKSKAADQHITQGRKLVAQQKLNEALVQFQKALLADPSSPIAFQMVSQTNEMVKEKNRSPEGTVVLTPAERARREVERRINSLEGPPVLRPIRNQIDSLRMNNQTSRVIYESVGKLAGINVLFDPQGIDTLGSTTRNFNLDLNNVTLEEALNYVALVTHTFWKPISRNAIFVTQESDPKRQEYQDEVVKVFYIQNASTQNEFTEIFNGVRTGAKLTTGIFQVASQNAIIARGTVDTMALVEKLVHDLDRPKAEVLVDVMVLEVAKSRITNLGMALQGQNILTVSPGRTSTSTSTSGTDTTTTTGASIPLSRLGKISTNNFSVSLPGALAQALMTDSRSRLLQNPQVRVTDGGKGSLKIGSKIPYVSGSLNSAVATPGSIPYATTQFQQIDVGVNIDVSPHVNGPDDISMHIKVEISNVVNTVSIAGVEQPIIGQKVNEADVRMRDGEYSLLGGLSNDSDSRSIGGLPGISATPILGYLFGTRKLDREKDDIVIALVPHIIRAQPLDDQISEGTYAGTERIVRVERKQQPAAPAAPGQPAAPGSQPAPQLPPPGGGSANLLPPTNNPKIPITAAERNVQVVPARSIPTIAIGSPTAMARPLPVQPAGPPGTDVTPLQGMQQMGLAADPQPALPVQGVENGGSPDAASITVAQDSNLPQEAAPQNAVADAADPSQNPQGSDTSQPLPEPAPIQVVPEGVVPSPIPDGDAVPEQNASAPSANSASIASPDAGSYAAVGVPAATPAKRAQTQQTAVSKPKPPASPNRARVQLASTPNVNTGANSAPAAVKPRPQPIAASPAPVASAKPQQQSAATPSAPAPVQVLEGHLTQQPDSSTSQKQK